MSNATQQLFDEYVEAREAGEKVEASAYIARAGTSGERLSRWIATYEALSEIGEALVGDDSVDLPPELTHLGRYERKSILGRGGSSIVILAYDQALSRNVAVKIFDKLDGRESSAAVLREARLLAQLKHDNVIRILDAETLGKHPYISMDYVAGPSLRGVLNELREPAEEGDDDGLAQATRDMAKLLEGYGARANVVLQLARALAYCHGSGVLHRDIKPENVLLEASGRPKLIDFGLAHLEGAQSGGLTRELHGTVGYVSPEQVRTGKIGSSASSEIFVLGTVLYELLTLVHPFQGANPEATHVLVQRARPAPLRKHKQDVPLDLERICLHCLELEPERRYRSMDALADDLEAFLCHRAISLPQPSILHPLRLWLRRNKRIASIAAASAAGLLALLFLTFWMNMQAEVESLRDELSALNEHTAALRSPDAFNDAFDEWSALRSVVENRESSGLLHRFAGYPMREARATLEGLSSRLSEVLAQERRLAEAKNLAMDLSRWRATLGREESFCPECPYNVEDRNRGRVEIPDVFGEGEVQLFKQEPHTEVQVPFTFFEQVPLPNRVWKGPIRLSLAEGTYRLSCWKGGSTFGELDFLVDANAPLQSLTLAPLPSREAFFEVEVDLEALLHAARPFNLGVEVSMEGVSRVQTFWIARRAVTKGEMIEFASSGALAPDDARFLLGYLQQEPELSEQPCSVPWIHAAAYCAWKGCRMPTVSELMLALERREFEPAGNSRSAELSGSPGTGGMQWTVKYDKSIPSLIPPNAIDRERKFAFRLAFSGQPQEVFSGQ